MRILIFILSLLFTAVSTPAFADWSLVAEEPDVQIFIDFSTLKKGKNARAWMLANGSGPDEDGIVSFVSLIEANCEEDQVRTVAARAYSEPMGQGQQLKKSDDIEDNWEFGEPGTVYALIVKTICSGGK